MYLIFILVYLPFVSDACCVNTDDYRYFVRTAGLEKKPLPKCCTAVNNAVRNNMFPKLQDVTVDPNRSRRDKTKVMS